MELRQMIAELDKNIAVNAPAMAAMSDGFAARPEVSGKEFETSKEIVRVLKVNSIPKIGQPNKAPGL